MTSGAARTGPWASGILDVEGHRGARGLVVENTVPSFLAAFEAGVTAVEFDVRLSADGHPVVWHDPVLLPTKCVATAEPVVGARVDELTLHQLRTVDVGRLTLPAFPEQRPVPGSVIPTLAEVLDIGTERAPDVWWTIEVKCDPTDARQAARRRQLVEAVLHEVHRAGIERRATVHSFDWAVLDLSRELAPAILRSALTEVGHFAPGSPWTGSVDAGDVDEDLCAAVEAVGAHVVSPDHLLVGPDLVENAHARGLAVLPWTVNDEADLRRMLDLGVDGIVTDYPDRALALVAAERPELRPARS